MELRGKIPTIFILEQDIPIEHLYYVLVGDPYYVQIILSSLYVP